MMLLLAMLLAASCLPRRGHAAHGLDRRLPRGREALPGPGGGLRAGHQVSLATPRPFEPDARRLGLGFAPTEGNPRQVLRPSKGTRGWRPAAIRCVAHGGCWRWPAPWRPGCWPTRPPPARTPRPSSTPVGVWRRPDRRAQPRPGGAGLAAAAQPHPGVPGPGRARLAVWVAPITLLSHLVAVQFGWQPFRGLINQWRRHTLGLPPAPLLGPDRAPRRRRAPVLYGYSRWVVPKPPDWGQHLHVTG
jgi:hypothetical protein